MSSALKAACVFPGQGSQFVGMGKDLYERFGGAKALFDEADRVLGFPLTKLCFEGPEEELRLTLNAQPALVVVSFATLEAIKEAHGTKALPEVSFVAGHSLGEYTALAFAGVFDFKTAVYLARERGRLMQEAESVRPGTMAAMLGLEEAEVKRVCNETGTCVSNVNCPGQLVVSGDKDRVAKAVALVGQGGKGKAVPLPVGAAFHSPLMAPAAEGMRRTLERINLSDPNIPVVANITATPLTRSDQIKEELLNQLTSCVQWQKSVEYMLASGVNAFFEIGAGRVLSGLIRRIDKSAKVVAIGNVKSVMSLGG
ncbi:MAG: ACP S-malonyltransferase [Chloroflexota bacterium]